MPGPSDVSLRLADVAVEAAVGTSKGSGWILARLRVAHALGKAGVQEAEEALEEINRCLADIGPDDFVCPDADLRGQLQSALVALRGEKS